MEPKSCWLFYFPNLAVTALIKLRLFVCEFLLCCLNSQFDVQLIQKNYDLRTGAFPLSSHVTASSVTSATLLQAVPLLPIPEEAAIAVTAKRQQQSRRVQ